MLRTALVIAIAIAALPMAAEAQSYRCVGKDGKKYYGQSVPPQCQGLPVEQLNAQGLVVKKFDAQASADERAKKEVAAWWTAHPTVDRRVSGPRSPLRVGVVLVTEVDPPPGEKALRWLLLTSLPLASDADALRCVQYYQLRWLIERFHVVLKSGCRIERLQLQDALALGRALAVLSGVAWHLLALTLHARAHPTALCTTVVAPEVWQALWATQTPQLPLPTAPPDLRTFVRAVARLGGFLGRRRDGEPGPTTLWRGLTRLNDLTAAYWTGRTPTRSPPDYPICV